MRPGYLYELIDEELYYEISDRLEELFDLQQKELAKLTRLSAPHLKTNIPTIEEIREYEKLYTAYQTNRAEYIKIEKEIAEWNNGEELIDSYIYKYYDEEKVPITLIKEFAFSKYDAEEGYLQHFEQCVELLHWFTTKNVMSYKQENKCQRLIATAMN